VWQKAKAPARDELEISVLGPGFGEAILIHAGDNLWIAVDSCVDRDGNCATLQYLQAIGVNPHQVKHIVATHWHADHIRGLSDLVLACDDAEFYCSTVFVGTTFLILSQHTANRMSLLWAQLQLT
jgi:glyoxylase-like metal-dependent hydrolase (beta-lactamase superfamily II)